MKISQDIEQKLIISAGEGVMNAYTGTNKPDDFRIGAAVLTDKGNIYSSGSYYSDTYSLTLHAEQAALAHAAAHGEYNILAVAVAGNDRAHASNNNEPIYPCHMCKQLLWESHLRSKQDTQILIIADGKVQERLILSNIMNYTWPR